MHVSGWVTRFQAGLYILLIWCCPVAANADTLQLSPPFQAHYALGPTTSYWHDAQGLRLPALLALDPTFENSEHNRALNFGYTQRDTWLRTHIHNDSAEATSWMVRFEYPFLDHVMLYTLRGQHSEAQQSGSALPVPMRALAHRQAVFPLTLAAGEQVTLYTRISASGSKFLSYDLMAPEAFYAQNDRHNFWLATYFGMLLALSIYNLLLFFGLKERVFLYYALFAFGFTLAILTFNGLGTLMFWSFLGDSSARLVALGFTFASTMGTLFAQSFLNTALYCPRWHRAITYFRWYCWLALFAVLLLPTQPALRLMDITGFTASLLMLVCGLYCSWQRVPSARLFVVAWSLFLLGAAVFALRNLGALPANFITLHGIQIGSALEMLLLSFALAARFNKMKKQKEQAQAETVAMLKQQETLLEAKVAERTRALERLANHDMLTGLLNRNGLARSAEQALERSHQQHIPLCLFMCDLDRFKPINDEHGHEAGDFVLQQVAKRLAHLARNNDRCARFGGDEFVMLFEGLCDPKAIDELRCRIDQAIHQPIKLPNGTLVCVGVSIGASTSHGVTTTLESLMREADHNMYAVKSCQPRYRYGSAG
ncbi:diguanylate cyclase [Halomonas sp. 7T]|uniref:7TM diverse intracellular signaling domain-containing protein n=1 Tax=Halomonas sp. 7T TaxID=2893469 RepID=UPI0021D83A5E|nr:7TM diverse intracellular signaling domain-containing protein [Halomonas sp. 7T]UXZ53372.1 diguanylate cyclase [Halomonas sp. 7T]